MESNVSVMDCGAESVFLKAHCPPMRRFCLEMFESPHYRPPVLEEMQEDIDRLIDKVARQYSDASCPELNYDELQAEGRLKLVHVLEANGFSRAYTRVKFFQFFATALNNHVRSLIHKYRFTEKRTGIKPPPKHARFNGPTKAKTVEVRLDDAEINVQVADQPCPSAKELNMLELLDDYESCLNPVERMVFKQLSQPNEEALVQARIDAHRGHRRGTPLKIKIKTEHLVLGLRSKENKEEAQFTVEQFNKTVLSIRRKITEHRSMTNNDEQAKIRRNAVLAQLEHVFNLQIPKNTSDMTVRRLLTICARDQFDKVENSPQVQLLLEEVGAKVPRMKGDVLDCRGTLYQRNSRICNSCGYRHTCAVESANFGLGKITISPQLLASKQVRTPAILADDTGSVDVSANSDEELEIITYLSENFKKVQNKGQEFFAHKEKVGGGVKLLFQVDNDASFLRVRFCSPSDTLKPKLRYEHKCYFCPPGMSVGEVISMIDTHAEETYAVA